MLVPHGEYLDEHLHELLPLVVGKNGVIVLTHWDRAGTHPEAGKVLVFAVFVSLLKTSGLVDRLTVALERLLRPVGLSGRDLVRIGLLVSASRHPGGLRRGRHARARANLRYLARTYNTHLWRWMTD